MISSATEEVFHHIPAAPAEDSTAAVMSSDEARCERVAKAVRAGIVWINWSQPTVTEAPRAA